MTPALTPLHAALVAFGAILLGHALQISNGFYHPVALTAALVATAFVVAGAARMPGPRGREAMVAGVLVAGFLSNILALATMPIGLYLASPHPASHPPFLFALTVATALGVLIAVRPARAWDLWFPALLVTYGMLGIWLIQASPRPNIDVLTVFHGALSALTSLASPYSITFPNIYADDALYGPGMVVNGRVQFGFPYPPLNLLMALPFHLARLDIRYAELCALVAGAGALGYSARQRIAPLAAAALLFTPRTFFVLEQAWTESVILGWLGLLVFAARRAGPPRTLNRPWFDASAIALGLLVAAKQHLAIALIFTGWVRRANSGLAYAPARLLTAVGVASAITLPFALWDPEGFWRSVVLLQLREPFRLDSLSVMSHLARAGWEPTPAALLLAPLTALAAGLGLAGWRLPRTTAGFALALGTGFLLMFLFSKKAFCNYYFLVIGLLLAAVAATADDAPPDPSLPAGRH